MKQITLARNQVAIIDDGDWERVKQRKWHLRPRGNVFYVASVVKTQGRCVSTLLHRFILDAPTGSIVDHVDGNPLNNTRANLRFVTSRQNRMNSRVQSRNKSGFKGVMTDHSGSFVSRLWTEGKHCYLGSYRNVEDAARAYDVKAREVYGEFARLNFPV